jgi:Na+/proline symporter
MLMQTIARRRVTAPVVLLACAGLVWSSQTLVDTATLGLVSGLELFWAAGFPPTLVQS